MQEIRNIKEYRHSHFRDIFIPKSNGYERTIEIPIIEHRAVEWLIKYVLEPMYETYANKFIHGFRAARSNCDIQENILSNLK